MKKIIILISSISMLIIGIMAYGMWGLTASEEVIFTNTDETSPSEAVENWPFSEAWKNAFIVGCKIKRLNTIAPGKYKITSDMTPIDVVHKLRIKDQVEVLIRIDLAPDADSLFQILSNELGGEKLNYQKAFDSIFQKEMQSITPELRTTFLFADTYAFTYGESPVKIAKRFLKFYKDFWTEERIDQAQQMGLSTAEIYILASMVKGETKVFDEASTIAGLYMNRLRKPMMLQCDATVKFANSLQGAQRILKQDLDKLSPYNTYLVDGLPPGPIFITEKKYLDAVLNFKNHSHLYMCAENNSSGRHLFTSSFSEHQINARRYQQYLNDLNIKR